MQTLAIKAIPDMAARMGRPPLDADSQTQATVVRLTVEQRARIAAVAPGVKLAEFIREAVEREIKRRSRAS